MTRTISARGSLWLGSLALAVSAVFFLALGGPERDYRVPVNFFGDSLFPEMLAKTILDHGWWWHNPSLAAPGSYDALAYPSNSNVDSLIVWLLSWFFHDIGRLINLSWLAMLALAGCVAAACLSLLGVSRTHAWCLGLLYAFAPYAVYRQIDHLSLVIYLIPVAATVALLLASGEIPAARRTRLLLAAGCVLIGFNYVYYAFFAAFFVAAGGAAGCFTYRRREVAAVSAICVALMGGASVLNLAPSLLSWARNGRPAAIPAKLPAESETYGLKIRQLISPLPEHSLKPLREWADKETSAVFPLENENSTSRLGIVGSLGFLGLLGAIFVAGRRFGGRGRLLLAGGQLTVAGVFLATIGGFGSLFALLISPDIRGWNRTSPFLLFFALMAAGVAADALVRAVRARYRIPAAGAITGALICVLGLYDQLHAFHPLNSAHARYRGEFLDVQGTVQQLESSLPPGSMIFQLPLRPFPDDGGTFRMGPYAHFRPYLVSRTLRWSYPPMSNQQAEYQNRLSRLTARQLLDKLKADGFAAILIDRGGYSPGSGFTAEVMQIAGQGAVLVSGANYIAFDLQKGSSKSAGTEAAPAASCGIPALYSLDRIADKGVDAAKTEPVGLASQPVTIAGWAVDPSSRKLAARVDVLIDGEPFDVIYGTDRPDVASQYKVPAWQWSGFGATIPGNTLAAGSHRLAVRVLSADRKCYQESPPVQFSLR